MYQLTSPLVEQGVLLKREEKCKNDTQSNWSKYFQRLEHMQWAHGATRGIVSSKNAAVRQNRDGTYQKSAQETKKQKMPLFLKHLNGWHQNVKRNNHFKKNLKRVFICNNKQEDKTHQKQELKKELFKKKTRSKKIERSGKSDWNPGHANRFGGGKKYLHLQHRHYHLNHLSVSL